VLHTPNACRYVPNDRSRRSIYSLISKLECGPMPNVMVALPNIGGTLCSTPQSLADAHYLTAVQQRCQDAKAIEISWGAPNYRIDLSR